MTVTHNGGTFGRALMAANGMPFATVTMVTMLATVVRVASMIVADQPSSIGETVPSGTCPLTLSFTGSGVKSECRLVLKLYEP